MRNPARSAGSSRPAWASPRLPRSAARSCYFGGRDGFFYALATADGRQIWKSRSLRAITAPPLAADGFVCIQSFYGTTQAFESQTGKELWRANLGGSVSSTPIVSEEAVYLATYTGVVYALR